MKTQNSVLWQKDNYSSAVSYIAGQYITEYDISKANISVLYYMGAIDRSLYEFLYHADKQYREVFIGKMQRDNPKISEIKAEGIRLFRKRFFEANGLADGRVLAIKSDAIFVIGDRCQYTKFDNVEFKIANVYTVFARLGRLEIYYGFDNITGNEVIDVKGIKDYKLELHREYMITHLCDVFYKLQTSGIEEAVKTNSAMYEQYLSKCLPVGFYREFNSESMFRTSSKYSSFYIDNATQDQIDMLDISVNLNRLRDLSAILSDIYFQQAKKPRM